ncbi:hypothetical protein EDD85DRAFT_793999 [Armillaria nabsnona]|nr:hypothetical protein EDD85DRAFT_793999 [Armillaria nabsnona]
MGYTAGYSSGHEFAAAVCAGDVLQIGGAVERQGELARKNEDHHYIPRRRKQRWMVNGGRTFSGEPGMQQSCGWGLSSVDVGGDDVRERTRPQNRAPHVKNGRHRAEIEVVVAAVVGGWWHDYRSLPIRYYTPASCSKSPRSLAIVVTVFAVVAAVVVAFAFQDSVPNGDYGRCSVPSHEGLHAGEKAKHTLSGALDAAR